jgi:hypothetical protein
MCETGTCKACHVINNMVKLWKTVVNCGKLSTAATFSGPSPVQRLRLRSTFEGQYTVESVFGYCAISSIIYEPI